jgi:hypothetical protein
MFENKSTLIGALSNPMTIASMALTEIENRLGGNTIIADPNTPFCHLLEFGSSISASVINDINEKFPALYPKRARTMEELYAHMSDFDYLRMYSTPAQAQLRMMLPKKYLQDQAVSYNENYSKLSIPRDTVFIIGKYTFGLYYPINILINKYTNTFTVVYDTTETNPLHLLDKNVINKYDITYSGLDYLVMDFPIYQFAKSSIVEPLVAETGFTKKLNYNDDFYALRVFNYRNGTYTEMSQTQSHTVYDISNPTVQVQVLPDEKKVKLIIPQIYFDEGIMGSKLLIELYTTVGSLNIDTTSMNTTNIGIIYNVDARSDPIYTLPFKNIPFENIVQISSTHIAGGTNAITVDELRKRVVNDTLHDKVLITEKELTTYLEDNDFYVKKSLDNVTDRIYNAYKVIRDSNGSVIPSLQTDLFFKGDFSTTDEYSSFLYHGSDNSVTILPAALYRYDEDGNCAVPLTDTEINNLSNLTKEELINKLNTNHYLKNPYYLRISTDREFPRADTFDLQRPTINRTIFVEDNYELASKLLSFGATVTHDTVGNYNVTFTVTRSDDLINVSPSDIVIYAMVKSNAGKWVGTECTYVTTDSNTKLDTYTFNIPTNYRLTLNNEIGVTYISTDSVHVEPEHLINLTSDFHLVFMVNRYVLPSVTDATETLMEGVPDYIKVLNVGISRQYFNITLGTCLNDVIKNNIEISVNKQTYATYDVDVPARYEQDVYAVDENGYIQTTVNDDGTLGVTKLHEVGEVITKDNGQIVYAHRKGDYIRDDNGELIVIVDKELTYFIDMMFIDAKMFFSSRRAELDFQSNVYSLLGGYLSVIRNIKEELLERTNIYFKCVKSIGTAKINLGDGLTGTEDIEMSFRIVCYVPSYVKKNEDIQKSITDMTCSAIENAINSKTISMLDIFESVKSKMSDYIDHFDLLGINNSVNLQTFVILDEDSQPSIRRILILTDDKVISLKKQIDITFVALESNTNTSTYTE